MGSNNLHTIERFALDAKYYEADSARLAQSRISDIASSKLTTAFERVCNEYGSDAFYKIRNIQLDLGDIKEDKLDEELVSGFENQLVRILEALRRGDYSVPGVEGFELKDIDEIIIEGIIFYFNNGYLPFHVQHLIKNNSVKELFQQISEHKIPVFQKELCNSVTKLMAKRRIVSLFPGNELLQFFHFIAPDGKGEKLGKIYLDLSNSLSKVSKGYFKQNLDIFLREYFLNISLQNKIEGLHLNEHELKIGVLKYLEKEKGLFPQKWIPELLSSLSEKGRLLDEKEKQFYSDVTDYYFKYMSENQSFFKVVGLRRLLEKQSRVMVLEEAITDNHIGIGEKKEHFISHVANEVKALYKTVEIERIKNVIKRLSDEIITSGNISANNFQYWSNALVNEVKRIVGVTISYSPVEIPDQKHLKKDSSSESTTVHKLNIDAGNSVFLAYWTMFLSSGIVPFRKLYSDPTNKLKSIFSDMISFNTEEAAFYIKNQVNEKNVMIVGWWIKENLGDDLFTFFKSHLQYGCLTKLEGEFTYPAIISSFFFANGNFPWPEISFKSHSELVTIVNSFAVELDEFSLEQLVYESKLFESIHKVEKVFALATVPLAKKLIQVKKNLEDKGLIAPKWPDNEVIQSSAERAGALEITHDELFETGKIIDSENIYDWESVNELRDKSSDESSTHTAGIESKVENTQIEKDATESIDSTDSAKDMLQDESFVIHSDEINNEEEKGDAQVSVEQQEVEKETEKRQFSEEDKIDFDQLLAIQTKRWQRLSVEQLLNELAFDIINFKSDISIPVEKIQLYIFKKIEFAIEMSYYQTAAMLVAVPQKAISELLSRFTPEQREVIKKLVKNYRSRFVSLSEDIRKIEEESIENNLTQNEENHSYFIQNAGLVLLNPYLLRLFKRFELIQGKEFVDNVAKEKAVYLLQYIANKGTDPEEWELTLNKIICGIPLGVPLKTEPDLSDEDKQICDGLLDAMVKNWGALKNTSADGLRTSFLMRDGTIVKEATGWKLRIEKKVYDILLEKLPWGYSMIHLPWMEIPLYTEWEK